MSYWPRKTCCGVLTSTLDPRFADSDVTVVCPSDIVISGCVAATIAFDDGPQPIPTIAAPIPTSAGTKSNCAREPAGLDWHGPGAPGGSAPATSGSLTVVRLTGAP